MMKMVNSNVFGRSNSMDQTDTFIKRVDCWTWSELLRRLSDINSVFPIHKLADELVERLALPCMTSTPSSLSSKCSSFRSSCDSKSTTTITTKPYLHFNLGSIDSQSNASSKSCCFTKFWWFEDLSTLDFDVIEMVVRRMVFEKFDHVTVSRFLFHYQRVRIYSAPKNVRGKFIENLVNLLVLLDLRSISIKGLFETLRISSNLKLRKSYKSQLELLIGSQLDQATIDDLLLPSSYRKNNYTKYNVNIIIRLLKNFLLTVNVGRKLCSYRLRKVARLVDLYATEIAPDVRVKPSKFIDIVMLIPDSARDSCDQLYRAIEIYLEVHSSLSEEQKMKVCSVLNYNKLSPQVLSKLWKNSTFPLLAIVKALVHSNSNLTSSIKGGHLLKLFENSRHKIKNNGSDAKRQMHRDQILLMTLARNKKLIRAHLQEMGLSLLELEKISSKLLLKAHKSTNLILSPKVCCVHGSIKHLPKLCS